MQLRTARVLPAPVQSSALLQGGEEPHWEARLAHPRTDHFSFSAIHAWRSPEAELRSPSFPSWTLEKKNKAQLAVPKHPPEIPHTTSWGFPTKTQPGHQ